MQTHSSTKSSNKKRILKALKGSWSISTHIKGLYFGQNQDWFGEGEARFEVFENNQNQLLYHEKLLMQKKGARKIKSFKEYCFHYLEEEDALKVFFVDDLKDRGSFNRLYHSIELLNTENANALNIEGHGRHLCGDDVYSTIYQFDFRDKGFLQAFKIIHKVIGPKKNYSHVSIFG